MGDWKPARWRTFPRDPGGLLGAALLWIAGLAPSLLPRPLGVALLLAGLLAWIGYGLGCLVSWGVRRLPGRWRPAWARRAVVGIAGAAWVVAVVLTVPATTWQREQAQALGMADPAPPWWVLAVGGVLVGWGLILVGRAVRALARRADAAVEPRLGGRWSRVVGLVAAVAAVTAAVAAVLLGTRVLFTFIDAQGSGLAAPASAVRSGGPGSLVGYDGLGSEGQRFVTGGPTGSEIGAYTGRAAQEPVRVFVGLGQAATPQERARLAVQELERTGGLRRHLVVVAIATGNGYLDPALVSAPEFLTDGDIATVSTQYSVLPSWLSFLVDQRAAGDEARALWAEVSAAVDALPVDSRPQLAVSGESLGAFGSQATFAGMSPDEVAAQAAAAVWVGTPSGAAIWSAWREARSSGPAWEPVVGDATVARAPATARSAAWTAPSWGARRVVLTQHANDPVSWWAPDTLLHNPDWLAEPRGPGVDPRTTWWPGVFFLQSGLDLVAAGAVPAGIGHNYGDVSAQAWAYALSTPGASGAWTAADTERLASALAGS